MKLTAQEISAVAEACAAFHVPLKLIRFGAELLLDDDEVHRLSKLAQAGTGDPVREVTQILLERINGVSDKAGYDFVRRLVNRVDYEQGFQDELTGILGAVEERTPNHEGLFSSRDNFFSGPDLQRMTNVDGPRTCCLVGDYRGGRKFGTGFLIGPDLILTNMHVFDDLISLMGQNEVPKRFQAVFDYEQGHLPKGFEALRNAAGYKVVGFADPDWLHGSSPAYDRDGKIDVPTDAEVLELRQRLDYAVVRLTEPVGEQSIPGRGTQARGWFRIGNLTDANYDPDIRIAVPQHPQGFEMKFSFGRITEASRCKTRVRYREASTSQGSSGAPCIVPDTGIIALHNAAVKPNGVFKANQAIRLDRIPGNILPTAGDTPLPGRIRPWKVDEADGTLVPIIGRDRLISWMMFALQRDSPVLQRRDRIFVAYPVGDDATGLSFTLEIVETMLSGEERNRIVPLGGDSLLLPSRPEELALVIGTSLGIPEAELRNPPRRPAATLPDGADDGDKIDRWSSHKMPQWFMTLVARHRDDHWRTCWVVLDDLADMPMSREVANFVSGLVGADTDESMVDPTIRRFRWLFLGRAPTFLTDSEMTIEQLDPHVLSEDALFSTLEAAARERGQDRSEADLRERAQYLLAASKTLSDSQSIPVLPVAQQFVAMEISNMSEGAAL